MRYSGTASCALIAALAFAGCAHPRRGASVKPPPLRRQIVDHVNSYLRSINCGSEMTENLRYVPASGWPCAVVLRVAVRGGRPIPECQETEDGVSELPYRSPDVDAAVFETMRANLTTGLKLLPSVRALWLLAVARSSSDCDPRVQERLHDLFWSVQALSGPLVESVGARLGCRNCKAAPPRTSIRDEEIQRLLARLAEGITHAGVPWRGIPAVRGSPEADPVLLVAIARAQEAIEDVPDAGKVTEELRRMGVAVRGARGESNGGELASPIR